MGKYIYIMDLKKYRKRINKTQRQVAELINVSTQTYQNYELRKRDPDFETLIKIADIFNVSLDELLGRECKMINVNFLEKGQKNIVEAVMQLNRENLLKVEAYTLSKLEDQNK